MDETTTPPDNPVETPSAPTTAEINAACTQMIVDAELDLDAIRSTLAACALDAPSAAAPAKPSDVSSAFRLRSPAGSPRPEAA